MTTRNQTSKDVEFEDTDTKTEIKQWVDNNLIKKIQAIYRETTIKLPQELE